MQFKNLRKVAAMGFLSSALVLSAALTAGAEPTGATTKNLSTNFTLINLETGSNGGTIKYYKADGTTWRADESFTMAAGGDQVIKRQYDPAAGLTSGSGSVVVSASGRLGALVQILSAYPGSTAVPTSGAYSGAVEGAANANVPLVIRRLNSASGLVNSQIIVQNTSNVPITADIKLVNPDGTTRFTKSGVALEIGISFTYDLDNESASNIPDSWFGSAAVSTATASGALTVVSNLFSGAHALQTYNAFTTKGQVWLAPLFTVRLANTLSTPISVQNLSATAIPVDGIVVSCIKDAASPGANFTMKNVTAVGPTATYNFNPVTDQTMPTGFFGSCRIETTGFDTVAFVQMRVVSGDQAGAYEAIKGDGVNKKVSFPLYAKRLANGLATAITIQNLNKDAAANVSLAYKGSAGLATNCTATFAATIPAGGSLIQNHRTPAGVTQIGDACFGTLVVTSSDQPIDGFVQLTDVSGKPGDTFQAHDGFATP